MDSVAGIVRIVVGAILFVIGLPFLVLFLLGLIPMAIGAALIASGLKARDKAKLRGSLLQQQHQMTMQQQIDQNIMMMRGRPLAPPSGAERYCPVCGGGNLRSDSFCQQCGKPLPAPP